MLADVDAGSDTPSLVGKVLKWRKESPAEGEYLDLASNLEFLKWKLLTFAFLLFYSVHSPESMGRYRCSEPAVWKNASGFIGPSFEISERIPKGDQIPLEFAVVSGRSRVPSSIPISHQ